MTATNKNHKLDNFIVDMVKNAKLAPQHSEFLMHGARVTYNEALGLLVIRVGDEIATARPSQEAIGRMKEHVLQQQVKK